MLGASHRKRSAGQSNVHFVRVRTHTVNVVDYGCSVLQWLSRFTFVTIDGGRLLVHILPTQDLHMLLLLTTLTDKKWCGSEFDLSTPTRQSAAVFNI